MIARQNCLLPTRTPVVHSEAVCKSVLNTLLTKLEKLEEKDKQKLDSTPSSRRRSVSTSNRKVSVSSERLRKLRRVLKDRKDR